MEEISETIKLEYTIHSYSSYSSKYAPENIMVSNPTDQLSRWFTDSTSSPQYIMLELKSPSVVETITFGKFIKAHVSDLKKFQVYGGIVHNNLSLLLTSGLKKDSATETFRLRNKTHEGFYLPLKYIKIVPLQSWGPAYNYTIWYVELRGRNQREFINNATDTINLRIEEEAVRLILKHLRRRRYNDAYEALSRETGVKLEGELQERLWNALVENEDYKLAEQIIDQAAAGGEFEWFLSWQPLKPEWQQVCECSAEVEERLSCGEPAPARTARPAPDPLCADRDPRPDDNTEVAVNGVSVEWCEGACAGPPGETGSRPGPRGGHQLVVDSTTGTLYLFGGWNGTEDLDDLWSFSPATARWRLLSAHSGTAGGPSPRSCHKMVFEPHSRTLYTLGRYLDNAQRVPANMKSELYTYSVDSGTWSMICEDTGACGGPRLVFDHQMCIDADARTIYVFGGRVLPCANVKIEEPAGPQYSGLYAYYIATGSWHQLLPDQHNLNAPQPRVSHSMLFHPVQRRLYIFGGQRNKEQLGEVWWWDVGTGECRALCGTAPAAPSALAPPAPPAAPASAGLTQRATLDPDTDHMYVLSGMSKEKDKKVYNTLWMFSLRRLTWSCLYRNDAVAPHEPRPRFAHQLVYDPVRKIHYLFGGNPGNSACPRLRLDDLWSLRLRGPDAECVVRAARARLREAHYRALVAAGHAHRALTYLRTHLSDALDHTDPLQVIKFQKLATVLFAECGCGSEYCSDNAPPVGGAAGCALCPRRVRALQRRRARATPHADLAHALAAVLGADEELVEQQQPFEEVSEPPVDTWEVGEEAEGGGDSAAWRARGRRVALYTELCRYFRPSAVPPAADVTDLVAL